MATMSRTQDVYFGPSSTEYSKEAGQISANTAVTVKWAEKAAGSNEVWYYIAYGTNNSKRGYVPASSVKDAGSVGTPRVLSKAQRYMHAGCDVYYGMDSANKFSAKAGSVDYGESVQYLGVKEGSPQYALIEYQVVQSEKKKRGWVDTNKIGVNRIVPTLTVGEHPSDQDMSSEYYGSKNFYYPGYLKECTAYCWGRAREKCGRYIVFDKYNAGKDWYKYCDCTVSGVTKSSVPVTNSVCSCKLGDPNGHVIFVELVKDGYVYYTEANMSDGKDGIVKKLPIEKFPENATEVYGYLVL